MGLLATAMGLEPGKEGMKELTKRMKQGKIGMDELFKFLDMAAGRARSTGAYDLAINSKQAYETRMANSYKGVSYGFGKMFDQEIKSSLGGMTGFLDKMNKWLDEQEKLKAETGEIGKFETAVSLITSLFEDLADTLQMVIQGWGKIFSWLPGGGGVGSYLASRELSNAYYKSKGATTLEQRQALDEQGRPGFDEFRKAQFKLASPNGSDQDYLNFVNRTTSGSSMFANINPTSPQFMVNTLLPVFKSMLASIESNRAALPSSPIQGQLPNAVFGAPVINIQGATDPVTTGNIVDGILRDLFKTPR